MSLTTATVRVGLPIPVPLTVKSAAPTFVTASLNATRHTRLSALVIPLSFVLRRLMEVTIGAVLSIV